MTLESGLQYQVLKKGKGTSPTLKDMVTVLYQIGLIDGKVLDSSDGRDPARFMVRGVFKGLSEALQLMKPGARWKLFVPTELAYGQSGQGEAIGPNAALIFEVELIDIETNWDEKQAALAQKNLAEGIRFLEENGRKKGVVTLKSGLQYQVLKEGNGPSPTQNDKVTVDYVGRLIDGTVFDSSVERGKPLTFPVNGVIQGWSEALQLMKPGAKWKLFIPPKLAYGERGAGSTIGPNTALIFEVDLLEIAGTP